MWLVSAVFMIIDKHFRRDRAPPHVAHRPRDTLQAILYRGLDQVPQGGNRPGRHLSPPVQHSQVHLSRREEEKKEGSNERESKGWVWVEMVGIMIYREDVFSNVFFLVGMRFGKKNVLFMY